MPICPDLCACSVETEILNHRVLRHPHVIEFKEVFITSEYICIVMEYASGGNLFSYVQRAIRLKEPAARWFFQQLIIGLDYCHRRGVVNRDIKLENTLLTVGGRRTTTAALLPSPRGRMRSPSGRAWVLRRASVSPMVCRVLPKNPWSVAMRHAYMPCVEPTLTAPCACAKHPPCRWCRGCRCRS